MSINIANTRINKLREYMVDLLNSLLDNIDVDVNVNMLSKNIENFSLDKIPTETQVERWIDGTEIRKDLYSFRSRFAYSIEVENNLQNIGFFEELEDLIYSNNEEGILPEIENVESIECMNCGSLVDIGTNTASFDIQIQVTFRK